MTTIEAIAPASPASVPAPAAAAPQSGRFHGREGEFFGLLVRGHLLLMVTLGIYRFWLNTDIRRYLWGHTEIAGDGLEYIGTARELLLGFLMAIVLLVPINALLFIGALVPDVIPYVGPLGFVLLALLGQFAVFRARRYRLTRTVYRGVRLYQTGSGWNYSLRSNLWSLLVLVTAGLAYPWAAASLERYKMHHTHYGDLSGWFAGSGTGLFFRGILLWLIVMAPLVLSFVGAVALIDWVGLAGRLARSVDNPLAWLEAAGPEAAAAFGLMAGALAWTGFTGMLLYPVFRAIVLRWWLSGLRLGEVAAASRLRVGQVYGIYARFLGYGFLFGLVAAIFVGLVMAFVAEVTKDLGSPEVTEIANILVGLAAYVAVMLGYSAIYQATVTIRFWRLSFETTEFSGLAALDRVEARGAAGGPLGEGLADALDVGGL